MQVKHETIESASHKFQDMKYSRMPIYKTFFGRVYRAKVSYIGISLYVRCFYRQVLNQKVLYLGVSYFSM